MSFAETCRTNAMPLKDFIDQVMDLLADPPPSGEILVQGGEPL
jgi:hypothetical protein